MCTDNTGFVDTRTNQSINITIFSVVEQWHSVNIYVRDVGKCFPTRTRINFSLIVGVTGIESGRYTISNSQNGTVVLESVTTISPISQKVKELVHKKDSGKYSYRTAGSWGLQM